MSGNNIVNTVTITAEQLNKELVNLATVMGTDVAKLISYYKVLKTDSDSLIAVTNTIAATLKDLNHKNLVAEGIDEELKLIKKSIEDSSEAANTKITENKTAIDKAAEDLAIAKIELTNKITEIEGKLNPTPGSQLNLQEIKDSVAALEVAKSNLENSITRLGAQITNLPTQNDLVAIQTNIQDALSQTASLTSEKETLKLKIADLETKFSQLPQGTVDLTEVNRKITTLESSIRSVSDDSSDNYSDLRTKMTGMGEEVKKISTLSQSLDQLNTNLDNVTTSTIPTATEKATQESKKYTDEEVQKLLTKISALEHRVLELETKP